MIRRERNRCPQVAARGPEGTSRLRRGGWEPVGQRTRAGGTAMGPGGPRGAANPGRGVGDGGWGLGAPQHWSVRDEVPERGDLHGEHRVPRGLGWGLSAHEAAGGTPTGPRERPGPGTATRSCFVGAVLAKALLQ